jgi:hypothetical protein
VISVTSHAQECCEGFGAAWNRFWFTPRSPRPLALVRCLAGAIALYTIATYTPDLQRFFGPGGVAPLETVREIQTNTDRATRFSVLDYVETPSALWTVHGVSLLVLTTFILGLFSRLMAVASLVVVLSYFHRGPMLTAFLEPVLAFTLFYLCLGPSGAVYSLDQWRKSRQANAPPLQPSVSAAVATRLLQVHLAILYAMMALGKLTADVWWDGTGVWWLIARPESRLIDLTGLHASPYVVNLWTHSIVLFEVLFPLLIWNRTARPLLLAWSGVHWGLLALVCGQPTFALLVAALGVAFLDSDAEAAGPAAAA